MIPSRPISQPMVILCGPSGVGKTTLLEQALKDFAKLVDIITYTTRAPRAGESEGQPYHFVTQERFRELIGQKFFVEYAEVHGQLYGTPVDQIEGAWAKRQAIIMDVDVQGAQVLRDRFPQALGVFIVPPTIEALRQRLLARGGGRPPKDLEVRLRNAQIEMDRAGEFPHQIVNDDFDRAYAKLQKLIEDYLENR